MEMRPPIHLVGRTQTLSQHDKQLNGVISKLMDEFFNTQAHKIRERIHTSHRYGIMDFTNEEPHSGTFTWMAAVEVSTLSEIPEGLIGKSYPTLLYAVVTLRGTADQIPHLFDYMYKSWIPESGYESSAPFSFQLYGEHYRGPSDSESIVEVYFPIRSLASHIPTKNSSTFKFGAVFIPVTDMPQAVKWYSNVLDIAIDPRLDVHRNEKTIYHMQVNGVDLLLDNYGAVPISNPNPLFYLKTPNIQVTLNNLKAKEVLISSSDADDASNSISFIVSDPDGNKIMFHEETDRNIEQHQSSSILTTPKQPVVPALFYDGAAIDILYDYHDDAIKWFVDKLGWSVKRKEHWKPDPLATHGRMTQLDWGTWLVSALTSTRLSHHYADRGTIDGNVRWCWRTYDLEQKHTELQQLNIRTTDLYEETGGIRYFDFWATAEGIRLTIQEDKKVSSSALVPSWIRIGVSNFASSIDWYKKFMGMHIVDQINNKDYVVMSLRLNHKPGELSLWILEQLPSGTPIGKVDAPIRPYCFIRSRQQFFTYHQYLQSCGIEVSKIGGFTDKGLVVFHFYDPDGNRLNISSI
nr:VOC family protein [Paenibacillus sp. GSMTC-2017]